MAHFMLSNQFLSIIILITAGIFRFFVPSREREGIFFSSSTRQALINEGLASMAVRVLSRRGKNLDDHLVQCYEIWFDHAEPRLAQNLYLRMEYINNGALSTILGSPLRISLLLQAIYHISKVS